MRAHVTRSSKTRTRYSRLRNRVVTFGPTPPACSERTPLTDTPTRPHYGRGAARNESLTIRWHDVATRGKRHVRGPPMHRIQADSLQRQVQNLKQACLFATNVTNPCKFVAPQRAQIPKKHFL